MIQSDPSQQHSEVIDLTNGCSGVISYQKDYQVPIIEKSFQISNFQPQDIKVIENKANECNISYKFIDNTIQVAANQLIMLEFISWLYELLNASFNNTRGDCCCDEVSISTFHRLSKEDILSKAKELNIECCFRYHSIMMTGFHDDLKEFKNYLHQVEISAKRPLYPRYWDMEDAKIYSEIEVKPESVEFNDIITHIQETIPDVEIKKLIRIQNNYLMTHYVTNLAMRQEVRQGNMNRELLFHGTKDVEPSIIYKNFNTGFDIQCAKEWGLYGKGLYFAREASYSHAYSYKSDALKSEFKMILADVFVGKSYECNDAVNNSRTILNVPDGFDSVCARGSFHVIYNNFHSYPLYLVEYKTQMLNGFGTNLKQPFNRTNYPRISNLNRAKTIKTYHVHPSLLKPEPEKPLTPQALKRIQKELFEIQSDPSLENFLVTPSEDKDFSKWTVNLLGPADTPYEAGMFKLQVVFSGDYPMISPQLTFQTQIYHPCIANNGRICMGLLTHWVPNISMRQVLLILLAMLDNPVMEDPLMVDISTEYKDDKREFEAKAREWTEKYAN